MSTPPARAPGDVLVHLRRARDHADRHFAEPLDLAELAAVAGLSKYHFHRLFTATYRRTPAAYLSAPGIGLNVDDCQATYDELSAKGVEFIQPPSERPYGVEALCRDNSGNWLVLVEQKFNVGEAPATLD
jgi:hypothetical protein